VLPLCHVIALRRNRTVQIALPPVNGVAGIAGRTKNREGCFPSRF
jgi:hypothetical protein